MASPVNCINFLDPFAHKELIPMSITLSPIIIYINFFHYLILISNLHQFSAFCSIPSKLCTTQYHPVHNKLFLLGDDAVTAAATPCRTKLPPASSWHSSPPYVGPASITWKSKAGHILRWAVSPASPERPGKATAPRCHDWNGETSGTPSGEADPAWEPGAGSPGFGSPRGASAAPSLTAAWRLLLRWVEQMLKAMQEHRAHVTRWFFISFPDASLISSLISSWCLYSPF